MGPSPVRGRRHETRPPSVRDGLCFLDHLRNSRRALGRSDQLEAVWEQTPAFYFANPTNLFGPHDDVPVAPGCAWFDLELEVGAVIGRAGRDLDPATAADHIAGYTLICDWSARDLQAREMQQGLGLAKAKDKDSGMTLGPALVTVDELERYRDGGRPDFEVTAEVNGETLTTGSPAQMDWTFGELLAYASRGVELQPGDVFGSGTVPMGCLVEHLDTAPGQFTGWLKPGDEVVLRGEGLGETRQRVVAGTDASLLVDTLYDLALTREMLDAMAVVTGLRPITDAVNTHADGDHCYGNELLAPSVTLLAGRDVDHDLHETPPQRLVELVDADLGPVLTPYARKCFGPFDFSGITLRGPDCEVLTDTELRIGGRAVRVLPLGPAHTAGDVVVHVPDAGVLFAGDLLFIGGTPIMWTGPAESWMRACDAMLATGAQIVVPGHGPVTDQDGIADVRDYLAHVLGQVTAAHRAGRTWRQAADEVDLGRFAGLLDPERIVVNSHVIYRHLDPAVPAVAPLELFSEMARWLEDHTSASVG